MASFANRRSVVKFVATDTNAHGRDAGGLRHLGHICNLAVACLTFYAGLQVFAVGPIYPRRD